MEGSSWPRPAVTRCGPRTRPCAEQAMVGPPRTSLGPRDATCRLLWRTTGAGGHNGIGVARIPSGKWRQADSRATKGEESEQPPKMTEITGYKGAEKRRQKDD